MRLYFISFLTLFSALALADNSTIPDTDRKPANTSGFPVVAHLEKRNRIITIKKGPQGLVYTVTSKDGNILAKDLSEGDLQANEPDLYEFVKTAVAENVDGGKLDASVGLPMTSETKPPK